MAGLLHFFMIVAFRRDARRRADRESGVLVEHDFKRTVVPELSAGWTAAPHSWQIGRYVSVSISV